MSYPRNAASPPRIAIGAVVQISDGAVQSSGVSVAVRAEGGSESAGGGTITYGGSSNVVYYAPTQGETDYTAFVVTAYKTGCIPVSQTVITTASATAGYAGVDWGKVTNPTTTLALTGTTIATTQQVDVNTIKTQAVTCAAGVTVLASVGTAATSTAQTGDSYARLGVPAGASVSADVAAVKVDTAAILVDTGTTLQADITAILTDTAEIGAAGAGLTALPWNAAWDTEVQSECTDALNAYDPPTNTEMVAAFTEVKGATWSVTDTLEAIRDRGDAAWTTATGFSTLDAAGVRTAVGLASANLDTQLADIPTVAEFEARTLLAANYFDPAADVVARVTLVDTTTTNTDMRGTDSAALASVWTGTLATNLATLASHDPGEAIMGATDLGTGTGLTSLATAAAVATAQADLDILTGTNGVTLASSQPNYAPYTGTPPSAASIRAEIDSNSTQLAALVSGVDALPTNAELATALAAADDAVLAAIAALNNLSASQVNAQVVDALATDTYAELASVPSATSTLADKINWIYAWSRNKITSTATTQTLRNDADAAAIATLTQSDDGTTFTRGEWSS